MSRVEELIWLEGILLELKQYPEHNQSIIEDVRALISYRIELEMKSKP